MFAHQTIDCAQWEDTHLRFVGCMMAQLKADTQPFVNHTGKTIEVVDSNCSNCAFLGNVTVVEGLLFNRDRCTNREPELIEQGYKACKVNCRHMVENIAEVVLDGVVLARDVRVYKDLIKNKGESSYRFDQYQEREETEGETAARKVKDLVDQLDAVDTKYAAVVAKEIKRIEKDKVKAMLSADGDPVDIVDPSGRWK
jgi:hypothetical protein